MEIVRPRWSSWSFLVYTGGLAFSLALAAWVEYLARRTGAAATAGLAALALVVLVVLAEWFRATGHRVTGGVFAAASAVGVVGLLTELWRWFGWRTQHETVRGLHPAVLLLELALVLAAVVQLRRHRFALIVVPIAYGTWTLVVDVLSNGGTWTEIVSIAVGFGFWIAAATLDAGERRPYAFWLHVAAGLAIGGAIVWGFWHRGDWSTLLIALGSIAYVLVARGNGRSSWAVLGVVGLAIVVGRLMVEWTNVPLFFAEGEAGIRPWVPPLLFTCFGALLVTLGLYVSRARPRS